MSLNLSGFETWEPCTGPPSCKIPQQLTIYEQTLSQDLTRGFLWFWIAWTWLICNTWRFAAHLQFIAEKIIQMIQILCKLNFHKITVKSYLSMIEHFYMVSGQ